MIEDGNDVGLWIADENGEVELVARGLDPAPGAPEGAAFSTQSFGRTADVNADGGIAFAARMLPGLGGVTSADDFGIWGPDGAGGITLLVREGDPVPGRDGESFGDTFGDIAINALGAIVFETRLVPSNADAIGFIDDAGQASVLVAEGDAFPVAPGDTRIVSGISFDRLGVNDANQVAVKLSLSGTSGIFRLNVPEPEAAGPAAALGLALLALARRNPVGSGRSRARGERIPEDGGAS